MSSNSLTRQLNISLITDTPNPIIDFFNSIWSKLSIVETDVYHKNGGEFIYFIDGDEKQWIFFQDNKNGIFWCNHAKYWSLFETKFNLNYDEIQALTKLLVENALNSGVTTPSLNFRTVLAKVENALNSGVTTPLQLKLKKLTKVENALNNMDTTTHHTKYVEGALNK